MTDLAWLMIAYRIPPEPAAPRMAVWRRLKGLGAVYLQSGVCLVPRTDEALRRLRMLDRDIAGAGGEAVLLDTSGVDPAQADRVIGRFKADRDAAYEEFLDKCDDFDRDITKEIAADHFTYAELEENEADLKKLSVWLRRIRGLDFYGAARAAEAARRLKSCGDGLNAYAEQVFEKEQGR